MGFLHKKNAKLYHGKALIALGVCKLMETKRRVPITFYETIENLEKIERFAKEDNVSVSEYIRRAVQAQLEAYETDEALRNNKGRMLVE
jgi:uncharacterized protein with von Willebrand factor type A (vWA) domain